MNILIFIILLIIIYGLVCVLQTKNKIPYAESIAVMLLFLLIIQYNAFGNERLSYEIVGISIIVIGLIGTLPSSVKIKHVQNEYLYGLDNDENGVHRVVRYSIVSQ